MLAARVEPKNGPKENKKTGNFKPLVFDEFQTGVENILSFGENIPPENCLKELANRSGPPTKA